MVERGETTDSSRRGYGGLETVERVGPRSAIVDEGGLAVAWQYRPDGLCCQLRNFRGSLKTINLSVLWHLNYRPDGLYRQLRNFKENLKTINLLVP
jgi:hypothetical protein